MKLSFVITAN